MTRTRALRISNGWWPNSAAAAIACRPPQFAHKLSPKIAAIGADWAPAVRCVAGRFRAIAAGHGMERA